MRCQHIIEKRSYQNTTTTYKTTTIYLLTSLKVTNTIAITVLLLAEGYQN